LKTYQDGTPVFPVSLKMGIDKPSTPVQQHAELFPVKKKKTDAYTSSSTFAIS
jgi:hypothetical protein